METIRRIKAACFALCGVPQAILSYKQGHAKGTSWGLLVLWTIGEICILIYVLSKKDLPLIVNYLFNLLMLAIIIKYKLFPRK